MLPIAANSGTAGQVQSRPSSRESGRGTRSARLGGGVAAELISDLERIHQRKKAADKEINAALKAAATTLTSLDGIGPSGAARLLVEAGDITRFPTKAHFASWNGTAPIDASSGDPHPGHGDRAVDPPGCTRSWPMPTWMRWTRRSASCGQQAGLPPKTRQR